MSPGLTRRDFLKFSGLSLCSLAFSPRIFHFPPANSDFIPPIGKARVAVRAIYRYHEPSFKAERLGTQHRDQILNIYDEVTSQDGPVHNPRWYLLADGYVHSGPTQRVEDAATNKPPLMSIPKGGLLGEITVPFAQSYRWTRTGGWNPLYRLYFQSVHWITAVGEGPGRGTWYRLTDDRFHVHHHVKATYVRTIPRAELVPISLHVPPKEKRIQVSLAEQTLTAYEGEQVVLHTQVSTGLPSKGPTPNGIPTDTPKGRFRVQSKMPSRHMGNGELTSDPEAYELPGVPWVSYFHKTGVAFHGTYWHDNFGRMMSHGCVNMRPDEAKWLFRWTMPSTGFQDWYRRGLGTLVEIS
ncbi:MAG: L,D-transpeptidase [Anaerolineales bacterium]